MDCIILHIKSIVNSVGLVLGIIGTFLVWKFGIPESISKDGSIGIILEKTDDSQIQKWQDYNFRSKMGLLMLMASFALQLIANFL